MKQIAGHLDAKGLRFGIVLSRFNSRITDFLLNGAIDGLVRHGADPESITIVRVPGSFELPHGLRALARSSQAPDALLALGALVRGDTPHFEYLATEATRLIAQVSADTGIPVANGLLTCDSMDQAFDRAGGKSGNKGFEAAMTAIEMANLGRALGS